MSSDRELIEWQHAACLSIAEGRPGWDTPSPMDSPAMVEVRKLREENARLTKERDQAVEQRIELAEERDGKHEEAMHLEAEVERLTKERDEYRKKYDIKLLEIATGNLRSVREACEIVRNLRVALLCHDEPKSIEIVKADAFLAKHENGGGND